MPDSHPPVRAPSGGPLSRLLGPLGPFFRRVSTRHQVAFVLSGGGSLGAVQIGMLRALLEAGIRPDLVIGCSVGAINGAGYAADPTARGVARMERIWRRLAARNPDIMPGGFIPLAVQLARKGQALHDPSRLEGLLREELPASNFSELQIPFQCVATDLEAAAEHWFSAGPLIPALMASASLPAVYPARAVEGRMLIDGGVLNEIHTHRAVELGATELYVLHVGHLGDRARPVIRPFDSALRAYWTARRFRFEDDLARIPPHCTVHRLPAGETPRLRFDDFSRATELIETAYRNTVEYLDESRQGLPPVQAAGRISSRPEMAVTGPGQLAFDADDPDRATRTAEPGQEAPADPTGGPSGATSLRS